MRRLRMLCVFDSSPFGRFNFHIKNAYWKTSEKCGTRMTETVNMMDTAYSMSCLENKYVPRDVGYVNTVCIERTGRNARYLARDCVHVCMAESAEAVKETTATYDAKSFALTLLTLFRSSAIETFCALLQMINAESGFNIPDSDVQFRIVKFGYTLGGYISTGRDVDLKRKLVLKPKDYKRYLQRVLASSNVGSSSAWKNSFVLVSGIFDRVCEL